MLRCVFGVMFDFGFPKMFSAAMIETYFYQKYMDCSLLQLIMIHLFNLIILTALTAVLQFRNLTVS